VTIIEPSQNPNKTDADAAWEKETTNAINALQNQIQNLGSGVVSGNNRILVYATDAAGSDMSYEQKSLSGFSAVLSYAGDLPTLPISGLVFSPFSDTEVNTTIKQYIRTTTVQTSAPPAVGTYNTRTGEWSKSVGWQKTIPQADNVPTWVCHAVISGSGNVAINWTNPTLFYSNNRATGVVYYTEPQAATPSKPTATDFSFTTFVMTFGNMESGAANKWQQQPFSYDVTDTLKKQYTCEYIAEKHPGSNTATVTFSSPRGYVGIADDLESNNYQAGQDGWKIKRDNGFAEFGSAAIRGTLSIGQIPAAAQNSNVTAGSIGAVTPGELSASGPSGTVINGDRITTGTLSVDRLANNSIGMTQIATTLQSSNYNTANQTGWQIKQNGDSRFYGTVISRQVLAASGSYPIPLTHTTVLGAYYHLYTYYVPVPGLATTAWLNTSKTYVAVSGITGAAVGGNNAHIPNVDWGWQTNIILNTTWGGGSGITAFTGLLLEVKFYGRGVSYVQGTLQWKVFEVT
tara:strand:+ start:8111 stop:9658 length:1548 start_codon:yes stop_codon:yes gene_type:complete